MADSLVQTEPVSLTAAVTAAVNSTLGILSLVFDWSAEVTGGLLTASGAWIVVFFILYARAQVTPNVSVALTNDEVDLINMGKAEEAAHPYDGLPSTVPSPSPDPIPYRPSTTPPSPPPTV